jgi:quinol-cytochrome oxidoreductase complex cytochrome b subunit
LTRATRGGVALAGLLLAVLTASGTWLWWDYRPDRDQWIRTVHQVAAVVLLAVAVALVILAVVRRARIGAAGVVASIGVFVTVGAAYALGRLLPWDQIALSTVVARRDFAQGAAVIFDDRVKFVILGAREVSPSTYRWWAVTHVVLSALVVVALVLLWLRSRDRGVSRPRRPAAAPAAAPAPAD